MPPEASPPSLETPVLDWRPTGLDMFTLGTRAALGSVGGKLQSGRLAAKARWRWARLSISDRNFYEEQAMAYPSSPDAVLQRASARAAMFAGAVAGSLTGTMGQLSQRDARPGSVDRSDTGCPPERAEGWHTAAVAATGGATGLYPG